MPDNTSNATPSAAPIIAIPNEASTPIPTKVEEPKPVNALSLQKPTGHVEVNPAAPQPQGSQVLPAPVKLAVIADPKVVAHMDQLSTNIKKYAGQKDHNPFIWWQKNVEPLYTEYLKTANADIAKKLLAIPLNSVPQTTTEDQFLPARNPASLG